MIHRLYLLSVCDGTQLCRAESITLFDEQHCEAALNRTYEKEGSRPFWEACGQWTTIDTFESACVLTGCTGYQLDGGQWHKYHMNDRGIWVWDEVLTDVVAVPHYEQNILQRI